MDSNAILHEVQQLYDVSDRLELLAEQHPLVSEALITISENQSQVLPESTQLMAALSTVLDVCRASAMLDALLP